LDESEPKEDEMTARGSALLRFLAAAAGAVLCVALAAGCGNEGSHRQSAARPDKLTIIFSSDLLGKIRSCGCATKDMGGLGRWAAFSGEVRASVDNLIVVDAGDAFGTDLSFTTKEAELTFDAMGVVGLDAFTPGETEFVFGLPFLQGIAGHAAFPIIAANIVDSATGQRIFGDPYQIKVLKKGLRVAIVGILDDAIRFPAYIDASKFRVLPAFETLKALLPEMKVKADFLILLSHMGMERSRELAREMGDFDLIVVGHGKPSIKKLEKQGKTIMLATGGSGKLLGQIDLSLSGNGEIVEGQMNLRPLEDSIPLDKKVVELFEQYGVALTDKEMNKK
jgi:2',3'-cyclic-nucleotide 2'-phosphodiesterase (5'-nucleotidase family)